MLCVARQRSWTDPLLICQDGCFFQQGAGGLVVSGASLHGVGSPRKSVYIFQLGMCVCVFSPLVFRAAIHVMQEVKCFEDSAISVTPRLSLKDGDPLGASAV